MSPALGRRAAGLALLPLCLACAYYNGLYNAKAAIRAGDSLAGTGRSGAAARQYAIAAAKAETVLARYPRSRWRTEALYVAGRGHALAGECAPAAARLHELLARADLDAALRDRATLARAACALSEGQTDTVVPLLAPLLDRRDAEVATQAARLSIRAALALGDAGAVSRLLPRLPAGAGDWELASAAMAAGAWPRAESLLARRADAGDVREALGRSLEQLWSAGERAPVESLAARFDRSRAGDAPKASVHLTLAELEQGAGLDSLAWLHLGRARGLAADTAVARDVALRLAQLELRRAPTLLDVDTILQGSRRLARGDSVLLRLGDIATTIRLLGERSDPNGAARFLAAELARDSLGAPRLAHTLFLRLADGSDGLLLAPKALMAAALLMPDSAARYRARIHSRFGGSPFAVLVDGGDPSARADYSTADELLRAFFPTAAGVADSVHRARIAASVQSARSAGQGAAGGTPTPIEQLPATRSPR